MKKFVASMVVLCLLAIVSYVLADPPNHGDRSQRANPNRFAPQDAPPPTRAAKSQTAPSFGSLSPTPVPSIQNEPVPSLNPRGAPQTSRFSTPTFQPEINSLRKKYDELSKERASLMDIESLRTGIARLQQDITELKAKQKVSAAETILQQVLQEFPQSIAAKKARRMLENEDADPQTDNESVSKATHQSLAPPVLPQSSPTPLGEEPRPVLPPQAEVE